MNADEESLSAFIAKIKAATPAIGSRGADPNAAAVQLGNTLWSEIETEHTTSEAREAKVVEYAKIIDSAVSGYSDCQECFWEMSYFLQLGLERLSAAGALKCAEACVTMYCTDNVAEDYHPGWATAALSRCSDCLRVAAIEDVNDGNILARFKDADKLAGLVAKAGQEYRPLFAAHAQFSMVVQSSIELLEEGVPQTVFGDHTAKKVKQLLTILRKAAALCDSSADGAINNLEASVDLEHPDANLLLEAYNAMCEERPEDLIVQQQACGGPLTDLALLGINTKNEECEDDLLMESLMYCKLLLEPWQREDPDHMEVKRDIATVLRDKGLVEALLKQFAFWATAWGNMYGDCGGPCFISMLELVRYFPEILTTEIAANADVVGLIRQSAQNYRSQLERGFWGARGYETAESAAARMEALLDGQTEESAVPPAPAERGFGGFGGGKGFAFGPGLGDSGRGGGGSAPGGFAF
jgi:hypothetical protein